MVTVTFTFISKHCLRQQKNVPLAYTKSSSVQTMNERAECRGERCN